MGLINWCDEKISELKALKIEFNNGRPIVPVNMRYNGIPDYIETYQFRNEIPGDKRKNSLICFYSMEDRLWGRLNKINNDAKIFSGFAGIVGMDISPSVNMLRPRQLHSILINSIYDCLISLKGIKVAINCRTGDFSTINLINEFPKCKTVVFCNLGCKRDFADYSYLLFAKWLEINKPSNICLYGTITKKDINRLSKINMDIVLNIYHCHNYSKKENKKSVFATANNKYTINTSRQGYVLDFILSHNIKKSNFDKRLTEREVNQYGS